VATMFCGMLLHWGVGWQGLFYYPALIMVVIAVWAYFASRESPQRVFPGVTFGRAAGKKTALIQFASEKRRTRDIVKGLLKVHMFRQILGFSLLSHLLRSIFLFWTPKFLVDIGMGQVTAAMTSAVFPLLGCVGTIFLGWYTDKYARDGDRARMMWIMLVGLTVSLLMVALLARYGLEWQYALVFFLGLAGFCLYGPYSMSAGCLSLDIAGADGAGTCTGMIDGVGYIGGAISAWGAGIISARLGWSEVFFVLSIFSVLAVLSAYSMSRAFQLDIKARSA
jgi:MFS transporter, OPA family, glycerol-3-phosphate transporter